MKKNKRRLRTILIKKRIYFYKKLEIAEDMKSLSDLNKEYEAFCTKYEKSCNNNLGFTLEYFCLSFTEDLGMVSLLINS
jgi:hypothetical protein